MALTNITYMKLPDVPFLENQGHYLYLQNIKRIVSTMSGDKTEDDRVITNGDIQDLNLDTPRWEDLRFPASGQQVDTSSGRLDYDYENCGVNFAVTSRYDEDPLCCIVQLPHDKLLGSSITPHIHWEQNSNAVPNWLMQWRWVNNGEQRGAYALSIPEYTAFEYTSGNLQQITSFPKIDPPLREGLSSILDIRIFRDTDNTSGAFAGADPYAGAALLKEFDIHYKVDSFGSTDEYTK